MEVTQKEDLMDRFWTAVGENGSRADLFGIVRSYASLHRKVWARLQTFDDLTEEEWEFIADKLPDARRHALLHLADMYGNQHLLKRAKLEVYREIVHELLQGRALSPADRVLRLEEGLLGNSFTRETQSEIYDVIALNPDTSILRRLVRFVAKYHLSETERLDVVGRFLDTGKLSSSDIYALAWTDSARCQVFLSVIPRLLDMHPSIDVLRGIVRRGNTEQCEEANRQLLERFLDDHNAYDLALILGKLEDEQLQEKAWTGIAEKEPRSETLQLVICGCPAFCFKAWTMLRKQKPTKRSVNRLIERIKDEKTINSMRRYVRGYKAMLKKCNE